MRTGGGALLTAVTAHGPVPSYQVPSYVVYTYIAIIAPGAYVYAYDIPGTPEYTEYAISSQVYITYVFMITEI